MAVTIGVAGRGDQSRSGNKVDESAMAAVQSAVEPIPVAILAMAESGLQVSATVVAPRALA